MKQFPLSVLLEHRPVAVILRHAERDAITDFKHATVPLLTDNGRAAAALLGKELAVLGSVTLQHSPVPRCQQTAEMIAQGINAGGGEALVAGYHFDLGAPYLTGDWLEIVKEIDRLGMLPFIRQWFDKVYPENFVAPLPVSAAVQLAVLTQQLKSATGSFVNVTHDWNILILREFYFGLRHEDIGPPDFLDGMAACMIGGRLHLFYHDEERVVEGASKIS